LKKIVVLFSILIMTVSLCGCGKKEDKTASSMDIIEGYEDDLDDEEDADDKKDSAKNSKEVSGNLMDVVGGLLTDDGEKTTASSADDKASSTDTKVNAGSDSSADSVSEAKAEEKNEEYTDEQLCEMAGKYYQKYHDFLPPIVEVDSVGTDGIVTIHLYEVVIDDEETGEGHTATSDWYYVDRMTGQGENFFGEFIDLTEMEDEVVVDASASGGKTSGVKIKNCRLVNRADDTDTIAIFTIKCEVDGEDTTFDFKGYKYPDVVSDVEDFASIAVADVDNEGDDEILVNVLAVGNTLSDRTGELFIFKYTDGKFKNIFYMDVSDTPDGEWVLGYSAAKGAVYFDTASKDGAQVNHGHSYMITFTNGTASIKETDTIDARSVDF